MQGKRVNLTLADGDYGRLVDAAAAEGKSPSAFAADVLKAFLMRSMFQPPAAAPAPSVDDSRLPGCTCTVTPYERQENPSCSVHFPQFPSFDVPQPEIPVSRQERRALERGKQRKRV